MTDFYYHRHNHITLTHSLTHSLRSSLTHSLWHSLAHHDPHSLTCSLIMRGVADSGGALVHAMLADTAGMIFCFLYDQSGLASRTVTLLSHHHPMKCSSHTRNASDKIVEMRPHCMLCNVRASYSIKCCRVALCLDGKDDKPSCWKVYHT